MNREEVVRVYNNFLAATGKKNYEVVLGFGGALVMHGLRDTTNDLDLDIDPQQYKMWKGMGFRLETTPMGERLVVNDAIDLHPGLPTPEYGILIDGVGCYSLSLLLACYLNFSKDPKRDPKKLDQDAAAVKAILERINATHRQQ